MNNDLKPFAPAILTHSGVITKRLHIMTLTIAQDADTTLEGYIAAPVRSSVHGPSPPGPGVSGFEQERQCEVEERSSREGSKRDGVG